MILSILLLCTMLCIAAVLYHRPYWTPPKPTRTRALQKNKVQSIIKAPSYHKVRKNFTIYGNTSSCSLTQIYISNLVSLELLSANIPRAQYLIDDGNCWLDVTVNGQHFSHALAVGNAVTASSIALELSDAFTDLVFEFDMKTGTYIISANVPFCLNFKSGEHSMMSLCRELGFGSNTDNFVSTSPYEIRSPFRSDLTGSRFMHIVCRELDSISDRGILAQIPLVPPLAYATFAPGDVIRRTFKPMALRSLSIGLNEYDASKKLIRPYRFHGMFWSIVLEATALEQDLPWKPRPEKSSTLLNQVYWTSNKSSGAAGIQLP